MKFTTFQRWIYASGCTLPNALRALAQEIEQFDESEIHNDEYALDHENMTVDIIYLGDPDDDEAFRAGVCVSWKPVVYVNKE
jgi:hypothetical protein